MQAGGTRRAAARLPGVVTANTLDAGHPCPFYWRSAGLLLEGECPKSRILRTIARYILMAANQKGPVTRCAPKPTNA